MSGQTSSGKRPMQPVKATSARGRGEKRRARGKGTDFGGGDRERKRRRGKTQSTPTAVLALRSNTRVKKDAHCVCAEVSGGEYAVPLFPFVVEAKKNSRNSSTTVYCGSEQESIRSGGFGPIQRQDPEKSGGFLNRLGSPHATGRLVPLEGGRRNEPGGLGEPGIHCPGAPEPTEERARTGLRVPQGVRSSGE